MLHRSVLFGELKFWPASSNFHGICSMRLIASLSLIACSSIKEEPSVIIHSFIIKCLGQKQSKSFCPGHSLNSRLRDWHRDWQYNSLTQTWTWVHFLKTQSNRTINDSDPAQPTRAIGLLDPTPSHRCKKHKF